MTTPNEPTPLTPGVLRLTGAQLASIEPPVSGEWFIDFDEYEDFVVASREGRQGGSMTTPNEPTPRWKRPTPEQTREAIDAIEADEPTPLTELIRQARYVVSLSDRVQDDHLLSEMMALGAAVDDLAATPPAGADLRWVDSDPPDPRGKHCVDCGQYQPDHFDICRFATPPAGAERAALARIAALTPKGPFRIVSDELAEAQGIARAALATSEAPEKP